MTWETSEFDAAMRAYLPTTKRDPATVVNGIALNVSMRALKETAAADRAKIALEIGEIGRELRTTKKGRLVRAGRIYATRQGHTAPLAALIIQKRRAAAGLPGLRGKEMEAAMRRMIGARMRSISFHKSGFIQPIRKFASAIKTFQRIEGAHQKGQPKGKGIPAKFSIDPTAILINSAGQAVKIAGPALQRALNDEAADIRRRVAEKMQPTADKFNTKP